MFIQSSGGTNTSEGVSIFVSQPTTNFFTGYSPSTSCVRLAQEIIGGHLRIMIRENLDYSLGHITRPFKGSVARTEDAVNRNVPKIIVPRAVARAAAGCLVER